MPVSIGARSPGPSVHAPSFLDVATLLSPHGGPRHEVDGAFGEYAAVLRGRVADVFDRWRVPDVDRVVESSADDSGPKCRV